MRNFLQIGSIDVLPINAQIQRNPQLWNMHRERKEYEGTPHKQMDDIWVRHAESREAFDGPHFAKWYPAYQELPAVRSIIFTLMARMEATHLGGVLITKVPSKENVYPHIDKGWHPEFYNCKAYVVLQSNPRCVFRVEDEKVIMAHGDVWRIDNTKEHEVINDGDSERMTLIVCMRCE